MRIYLQPPQPSRGLQRIADALTRYLPDGWEAVEDSLDADLVIFYAIGRRDTLQLLTNAMRKHGNQKYAIIQVCLRSTMSPSTAAWMQIWKGAAVVWSYYDLFRAIADDRQMDNATYNDFNFYHAPLGADASIFYPRIKVRDYTILTTGLSRLSESVRECALAVEVVGGRGYHVGSLLRLGDHMSQYADITDDNLALLMSRCEFVSGLRRKEGFELPAVEGLLCGARPICFKGADWEWNYGPHAIYIEETDRQGVIDQLVPIFKHGAPPVTEEERQRAVERYDWETIVGGFYERLR